MSAVLERPVLDKMQTLARYAQLAYSIHEPLQVAPDMAGLLADFLRESLATAQDQSWFWTREWQLGERETEADLAAGRFQVFDRMEDLIDDLGWPQ